MIDDLYLKHDAPPIKGFSPLGWNNINFHIWWIEDEIKDINAPNDLEKLLIKVDRLRENIKEKLKR